ncbi:MAG TPA: 1-deoxy-D-xylulose-5-phosphate synthase [Candidatus Brocadiia bacterium]|nr:1-deoxy-D-xylulose-5-phosphate synthase [Planctomycetota bacterium]MDO8092863.1 1-deoxy-D-xylulose-5-phosphate synthase [Candidatus Brocadiales bacterium]
MAKLLDNINSPADLKRLDPDEMPQLAAEIRELIIDVVSRNPGHLASNLGVVELTLALHYCFDFHVDRLVWDVGHQSYVHKILTGRRQAFSTLRQYKGISGFPDKKESPYDPFTCGHSGGAISSALGVSCGNELLDNDRNVVVLVGDGAIGAGMSLEALNHAGDLKKNLLIVLNDNEMAISNTVGAFAKYLTKISSTPLYVDLKKEVHHILSVLPVFGKTVEHLLERITEVLKKELVPGRIFVDLGFNYFGPVDGHNVQLLIETLNDIKLLKGPKLLHVITEKGKGFEPASKNPERYHSAGKFHLCNGTIVETTQGGKLSYTKVFSDTIVELAATNDKIVAITAAMPDGAGLSTFKKRFPDRYFDVGICEQHGVGFANGLAAIGLKPVAAIYSTFLQRAYDQVFHDVCLQERENGIVFALDRAGIVGSDGPTHNGVFDIAYLRHLPGMTLMAPKDGSELRAMLKLAVETNSPVAIRYPRENIPDEFIDPSPKPFRIGEAEILREGSDGAIIAYGAMVYPSMDAANRLSEQGIEVTVINARFAKPLDKTTILNAVREYPVIVTVEDHCLLGGFGSAVLELVSDYGGDGRKIVRLGIPDRFVEHGPRDVILKSLGLDAEGIAKRISSVLKAKGSKIERSEPSCYQI